MGGKSRELSRQLALTDSAVARSGSARSVASNSTIQSVRASGRLASLADLRSGADIGHGLAFLILLCIQMPTGSTPSGSKPDSRRPNCRRTKYSSVLPGLKSTSSVSNIGVAFGGITRESRARHNPLGGNNERPLLMAGRIHNALIPTGNNLLHLWGSRWADHAARTVEYVTIESIPT